MADANPYRSPAEVEETRLPLHIEAIWRGAIGGVLWSLPIALFFVWQCWGSGPIYAVAIGVAVAGIGTAIAAKASFDRFGRRHPAHSGYRPKLSAGIGAFGWASIVALPTLFRVYSSDGLLVALSITLSIYVVWVSAAVIVTHAQSRDRSQ